jgi:hypothetical protein
MNDFSSSGFDGGTVGGPPSEAPATLPAQQPVSPPASQDEVIDSNRQALLERMAQSEDISDYAQERQDQVEAIDEGKDLPEDRKQGWYRRVSKAIQDATNEAAAVTGQARQPIPPSYQSGAQQNTETYSRNVGSCAERVNQYLRGDQQKRQNITEWHQALDPEGSIADWIIANDSSMAGQIMERCAANPEALQTLAGMPPHERSRWLSKLEGHLEAEQRFGQQMAQQQQAFQAARRTTQAPPLIKPPRGGANPPRDVMDLATRGEDVSAYINQRRQQERRER